MNPLDTPFEELSFRLQDGGKSYLVEVQDLCTRPLNPGLLEHCYMEPEEWRDELEDIRKTELQTISAFTKAVSAMWGRSDWTLLSPTPSCDDPAFQAPERINGRLCAAVLQSRDDFPVPYRGNAGPEPADYSEACVIYVAGMSDGLLPESVRALIRWERVAKPRLV